MLYISFIILFFYLIFCDYDEIGRHVSLRGLWIKSRLGSNPSNCKNRPNYFNL